MVTVQYHDLKPCFFPFGILLGLSSVQCSSTHFLVTLFVRQTKVESFQFHNQFVRNCRWDYQIWRQHSKHWSMHVFLDKNKDGYVSKNEMVQAINETTSGEPSSRDITLKRFEEMDWDKNGMVTFTEFLFTFTRWLGIEDIEDDEE